MASDRSVLERQMERVELRPFTLDGFHRRRQRKDRNRRIGSAVVALLVVGATIGGLLRAISSDTTVASPIRPFLGRWVAIDADGSIQHMVIRASEDEGATIVVHDDFARVCSGVPSTTTGTGGVVDGDLVIPSPVLTCDDGSEPDTQGGPPLAEQLSNMTFVHHAETDTLSDDLGLTWERDHGQDPGGERASGGMWPQTSLDDIRHAQERADAGDADYAWQVDPVLDSYGRRDIDAKPLESEIFKRFIREELGWESFSGFSIMGYVETGGHLEGVVFIRCAPGRTNPLYPEVYPEMPAEVRGCAPTIDDSRWETVRFNVEQEGLVGPSGIWVVTDWKLLPPGSGFEEFDQEQVQQATPPSDAEVNTLLRAFLGARVDGEGAERYLVPPSPDEGVPLLYSTTDGAPYERSEFERVLGPEWPTGSSEYKVRLFADGGTEVEQSFVVVRPENGGLGLRYGSEIDRISTTENGKSVPVRYRFLDGEVTFAAAPPWSSTSHDRTSAVLGGVGRGSAVQLTMFMVTADPRTGMGCEAGPPAADVDALVRSIRSNPELEATAPVAASVGGIDAVRMDVVAPRQLDGGDCVPMVLEGLYAGQDWTRLYLLDLPEGMSARTLAISISAADSEFERVVKKAAPILDTFEFHTR